MDLLFFIIISVSLIYVFFKDCYGFIDSFNPTGDEERKERIIRKSKMKYRRRK